MAKRVDNEPITHVCKKCGVKFTKTIRWLGARNEFSCPTGCGATIKARHFRATLIKVRRKVRSLLAVIRKQP